jgi:hypothetical protein
MITENLPAYLYQQYTDAPFSEDIQAFFDAYNTFSQLNLDRINGLNLPVYTNPNINGDLLDWVAQGIYGIKRPTIPEGLTSSNLGVYNTIPYDTEPYNQNVTSSATTFYTVNDDYFKRIITWNFYKGDGFFFNITWLKRRIIRFLNGVNGVAVPINNTYDVSIVPFFGVDFQISLPSTEQSILLKSAIQAGVLYVPFEFTFTVVLF